MKRGLIWILLFYAWHSQAQFVHDPVMIRQDSTWYLFCTGNGITVYSSPDMKNWNRQPPVFTAPPAWTKAAVPGFKGHTWAPDISYYNGWYYLYYAVSAFGKNTSAIGVAVNKTLDPQSPGFQWIDKGMVIQSVPGRDNWNAIDPNFITDSLGTAWLSFGSFWGGIKMFKLDSTATRPAAPQVWYTLATRHRDEGIADALPGNAAIEAPFIYKKAHYYYLFVSFDYCCRGEKSTYKMMVGRSAQLQGPYTDKENRRMTDGGGSLLLAGDARWHGVGHNAVVAFNGNDYLVFHGYDAGDGGKPTLRVELLQWENGWPVVKQR